MKCMIEQFEEIWGLGYLENLLHLELHGLQQVEILLDLSNLKKPRSLLVQCCGNLVEIQRKLPQSLEALDIYSCESIQKLPNLLSLKGLQKVEVNDCMKLTVEAILGFAWRSEANLCRDAEGDVYVALESFLIHDHILFPRVQTLNKVM